MGLVRLASEYNTPIETGQDVGQITATVSFRIDTRFNEYISKASPAERRLLRALRNEVLKDITWLTQRCAGEELPLTRIFTGQGGGNDGGPGEPGGHGA